ncbi:MAG: hypothetical protein OEM60_10315 [Gammaproteobacteria bacterium]|nr:hypothetical protein [Gammaproteobacteria bacterium]
MMVVLLLLSSSAHAQYIPPILVAAALSPLLLISFAIILGVFARSWRIGIRHTLFVFLWILLFGFASYFIENDYVIWTPLVLYAAHFLLMLVLILVNFAKRISTTRGSDTPPVDPQ